MNPLFKKRWARFRAIRRGYWSAWIFLIFCLFSFFAELFINNRALIVRYDGQWFFPTYGGIYTGRDFGQPYDFEANYRELKQIFAEAGRGDFVLLPLVPFSPYESNQYEGRFPPYPPSLSTGHILGTDTLGRDVLARLVYGFRVAIFFSVGLLIMTYALAIFIGCAMGYFGGWVDLIGQRLMEIWSNIPFLYVVIILAAITPPSFGLPLRVSVILVAMVIFNWVGMAYFMRTGAYREKSRDYIAAARVLGASTPRIIFKHLLPNVLSTVITFIPFTLVGGITALTALDFLGFGLPPPTPSWGELLSQGTSRLDAPWIVGSTFFSMVFILVTVTFIGEAIREAFDPRKFAYFR